MNKSLFLLFIFFKSTLYSQSGNFDCEKLYSKPIPFHDEITEEILIEIQNDIYGLVNCGIDSVDIYMLTNGPILGVIIVDQLSNDVDIGKITYQHLIDGLTKFKENEDYPSLRKDIELVLYLVNRKASIKNWEQDKYLFEEFESPDSVLNMIHELVQTNSDSLLTYSQLFEKHFPRKEFTFKDGLTYQSGEENRKVDYYELSRELTYLEAQTKAKELNKPILLYFTGYGCANARKLEHYVLSEEKIKIIIEDYFIFLPLYVDDKTEIPQEEWYKSNYIRTTINTIGKKNLELQIKNFQSNSQPLLVIINSQEEIFGIMGYIPNFPAYEKFLTDGLQKFKE